MHKQLVNQCVLHITLIPDGPMLIKSGKEGADPTKPDMEFVETYHNGKREIYLPGSSLKGAIRAQSERIALTLGLDNEKPPQSQQPSSDEENNKSAANNAADATTAKIYKDACFTEQMFGSTKLASRIRIEDAYHDPTQKIPLILEERNSVSIDRLSGATADSGLFNFQVCTSGAFSTRIWLRNFTLAQLGLMGLVLRDLSEGWFSLGFAKSRGLGVMQQVKLNKAIIQYPTCTLQDPQGKAKITTMGKSQGIWRTTDILGVGELLGKNDYEFPSPDKQKTLDRQDAQPDEIKTMPLNFGVEQCWEGQDKVEKLFGLAVDSWKKKVTA